MRFNEVFLGHDTWLILRLYSLKWTTVFLKLYKFFCKQTSFVLVTFPVTFQLIQLQSRIFRFYSDCGPNTVVNNYILSLNLLTYPLLANWGRRKEGIGFVLVALDTLVKDGFKRGVLKRPSRVDLFQGLLPEKNQEKIQWRTNE